MKEHHIHVNALAMDLATRRRLEEIGFVYNPSTIFVDEKPQPLYLFTIKTRDRQHGLWDTALDVMRSDPQYEGYIEAEVTDTSLFFEVEEEQFNPVSDGIPIGEYSLVDKPKGGDVHVYRGLETPPDELDELLLANDFYEVRTAHSRIFTGETVKPKDALRIYRTLEKYFASTGGIKKLEFEVVKAIQTVPDTFQLRPSISLH